MSAVGEGFPGGPFRLRTKFLVLRWLVIAVCGVGALGAGILYTVLSWNEVSDIWHDARIWEAGGPELPAVVSGDVRTSKFIFRNYKLQVAYRTPDGTPHQHPLELEMLGGSLDEDAPQVVRLSPTDPKQFALGPAVDSSGARYAAAIFFFVVGWGIAAAFGAGVWAALRQIRRVSQAARSGKLSVARLLSREQVMNNGRPTGAEKVRFWLDLPGTVPREVEYQLRTKGDALLTNRAGDRVLALASERDPSGAVLLLQSLYPISLDEAGAGRARALLDA
jgi:hypothetical protein